MRYLKTNKLYCFSPPVMIATFAIEVACAIYVLVKYKLNPITRLVCLLLVGLAAFQLAEYNVCESSWGVDSLTWARIGHVAISFLPPLGFHLATKIAGDKTTKYVWLSYAVAAAFSFIFMFAGEGLRAQECLGNYVIFSIAPWAVWPYAIYYYGMLVVATIYAWKRSEKIKNSAKRRALYGLIIGYLAFIVPTTTANVIDPSTIAGIPSIMCGFAVMMALALTFYVLPSYYKKAR